ncbi:hypothetical protein AB0E85_00940 [Streptomyces sp. NPDC029044]|uniref:hypothetical protein n=1 Tax=Streptomyces sp. NPDC029044 TaxID=3157198 RepID=UPI0033F78ED8
MAWAVEWGARALDTVVLKESERTDLPVQAIHRSCEALLLEILTRLSGHDFQPDVTDTYLQIAASAAEQAVPRAQPSARASTPRRAHASS